jgi:parallel beta-helix repeat protein
MKSNNDRLNHRLRFILKQLWPKNLYIRLLLVFILVFPGNAVLLVRATTAEVTPSITLDKNVIYVNPKTGDDSHSGKELSPLKTITQALKIASVGSTIKLASGTYSEAIGEVFPLIIEDKITLKGDPSNQGYKTIIEGDGYFVSPTGAGQNVTIAALKDAGSITGVTVTNNHSRGHGLWIESASPQVVGNTFTRNGNTGVSVNGNSAPLIENNYFYNNSGNGLLVYGTSKPEVINNTFKQTGFGVSLIQNTFTVLKDNQFDSNRIGIILEGNSQAVLRDNEIINSLESGLTAIAKSRVDLGTDDESGNNIFRSNRQLDIQNATDNEIPAVGTQVQGDTVGNINFERGTFVATNDSDKTFADLPPLPARREVNRPPLPKLNIPASAPTIETTSALPSPPPVSGNDRSNKELIFTPASSSPEVRDIEPVPYVPPISNTALKSNSSQIDSLSDVLGSRASQVKYKVLVEALNEVEEKEVRSLYPEAFKTVFQGQSWLQVGAFNNWDKARQAERTLIDLGLETYLIE